MRSQISIHDYIKLHADKEPPVEELRRIDAMVRLGGRVADYRWESFPYLRSRENDPCDKRERRADQEEVKARMRMGEIWVLDGKHPPSAHLLVKSWFGGPLNRTMCGLHREGTAFNRLELRDDFRIGIGIKSSAYNQNRHTIRRGNRLVEGCQVCEDCLRGEFVEQDG